MRTNWKKIFNSAFVNYGGFCGHYYVDKRKDGTRRIKILGAHVDCKDNAWYIWNAANKTKGGAAKLVADALRSEGFTVISSENKVLDMSYSGLLFKCEGVVIVIQ